MTRVGVALSGGGHCASVWAAGLLLYLADAGRNGDVGVIASVSGGSITNGQRMKPCPRPLIFSQGYRMSRSPRPPLAMHRLPSSATNKRWYFRSGSAPP